MKKVAAVALALVMLGTVGGVVLAADDDIDPAELNLVLTGKGINHIAAQNIVKTVDVGDPVINVTFDMTLDPGLAVNLRDPSDHDELAVSDGTGIATFEERIGIRPGASGSGPWYGTVTFYAEDVEWGTQRISVTLGDLDIKPGSYPNSINTKKGGVTPVAILGVYGGLDVHDIDVSTIVFYAHRDDATDEVSPAHNLTDAEVLAEHIQDVNFDGNDDLVVHFKTKDADWTGYTVGGVGQTATVYFEENDTTPHTLSDSVNIVKV